ncbi:NADP oxidoreductase [Actinoplanes ianthinogenes]|uniref:NADP oxidoreductase n=1 Tax=Actinoplanes ianthinogenes TaxID=122358 RepID=A0ABN6C870_9ACTN|nr:NAD(P)-binding domain-containing protein [Actinoplanes ianthinogenes]BCJ40819.1 NADP oxidoreductase [Actinoplanes ianthinogenes]GGR24996.1 NADP oxidoreductase [Actinoplanes ianthinogenes]
MNVGILGTGNLARALGRLWVDAGHSVLVTGRDPAHVAEAAEKIGAVPAESADLGSRVDVVVVAVAWSGLVEALTLVGADRGALAGTTVVDCTNPVDYATGEVLGPAAELVARTATGARVVKALHLFAGASWPWTGPAEQAPVVAICGDDPEALDRTSTLVEDLGGRAGVVGGLGAARQLEEAAGFVMRVVGSGHNPRFAVPDVDPALLRVPAAG